MTSLKSGGTEFKCYEEKKVLHFKQRLTSALTEWNTMQPPAEVVKNIQTVLQSIHSVTECLKSDDINHFHQIENHINTLIRNCGTLLDKIDSLNLPLVNPVIAESTDAGPGVGVNNLAVRFRFAECRIQNMVRRVRIHRACGDSAQNEAERTNSAIGDALVDGASLGWDYYKPFDGMSEVEVQELSSADVDHFKSETMEKNAWAVSNEIRLRIDDARDPSGGYLKAYVTEHPDDHFFWNGSYLKRYCDSSKSGQINVPGHGYFKKIFKFIASHIEQGELYIQYRKYQCRSLGQECDFCKDSQISALFGNDLMPPVPRPYPNYSQLPQFHYHHHTDTPTSIDGVQRKPDDFQPRSNLKKLFSEGEISSHDDDKIEVFSKKFIVPTEIVKNYIVHMKTLKSDKEKRTIANQQKRQDEGAKGYEDYDWVSMFENNCIDKLTVSVLDKYIMHKQLGHFRYKNEKVQAVKRSIASNLVVEEEGTVEDENEDVIMEQYESESDAIDQSESDIESEITQATTTRSNRRIRIPSRFYDFF